MKIIRTLPALFASFLGLIVAVPHLQAQLTWTGGTTNASDFSNYTGTLGTPPYDFIFDTATNTTGLTGSPGSANNLTFSGAGRPTYSFDEASLNLAGNITVTGSAAEITFGSNYAFILSNNSHSIDVGGANVEIWGPIAGGGSAGIAKYGYGYLTLGGYNSFSGGVKIHDGTLLLGSSSYYSSFWNGDGYTIIDYGPVGSSSSILKLDAGTTLGLAASGGSYSLSNNIGLCFTGLVNVDTGDGGDLTLNGTISGSSTLNVAGYGSLTLNGSNTYTGGTTVNSGAILNLGSDSNIDGSIISSPVGTGTLTLNGGSEIDNLTVGTITLANNIVLSGGYDNYAHVEEESADFKLTGQITGMGGIDWCTTSILTLTNANNTFSGGIDMREGMLLLGASSIGTPGNATAGPVGTGGIIMYGDSTLGVAPLAGSITLHNNIQINSDTEFPAYFDASNGNLTLLGGISGTGVLQITGTGAVTLTGNNTFSGDL